MKPSLRMTTSTLSLTDWHTFSFCMSEAKTNKAGLHWRLCVIWCYNHGCGNRFSFFQPDLSLYQRKEIDTILFFWKFTLWKNAKVCIVPTIYCNCQQTSPLTKIFRWNVYGIWSVFVQKGAFENASWKISAFCLCLKAASLQGHLRCDLANFLHRSIEYV